MLERIKEIAMKNIKNEPPNLKAMFMGMFISDQVSKISKKLEK